MAHLTVHERHMQEYPHSTISADELDWLNHMQRWGSDGYPVQKMGRKWWFNRFYNVGGCPTPFKTKREAIERVELFYSILRDKKAGRI